MNELKIGDIVRVLQDFNDHSYDEGIIISVGYLRIYTTITAYITMEAFGKNLTYWPANALKKCIQS